MDATRPLALPGAPPPSTVADIANGMGLSGLYGAGLRAERSGDPGIYYCTSIPEYN